MFDHNQRINPKQKALTRPQFDQLVENHKNRDRDHAPVVAFFGGSSCTWLISELDPETGTAFGLCDLGQGSPELGSVHLPELFAVRFPPFKLSVERDLHFKGKHPMSYYADKAREKGRIVS